MKRFFTSLLSAKAKHALVGLLVIITIIGSGAFALPKQADAQLATFDSPNFIKNTITSFQ